MRRPVHLFIASVAGLTLFSGFQPLISQIRPEKTTSSAPIAFVYVSSNPSNKKHQINAFGANVNGQLAAVQGSPFAADVQYLAANRKYLFGTNGIEIDSFLIASNGALQLIASTNAQNFNDGNCGGPVALFLDRTGKDLYDEDFYGNICANNTYQSFNVENSSSALEYLAATSAASPAFAEPLSFVGNDRYGYGASCLILTGPMIYGFERRDLGTLDELNINPPIPLAKEGDYYCPELTAADQDMHVAVALQPTNDSNWQADGPVQLAVYNAGNSGNLTTNSTLQNMPRTSVKYASDLAMSPSGKLIAVSGTAGLQVFHFSGGSPITHYTGLLTTDEVDQVAWDNDNHLYAIGTRAGKLFVFTVTPTGYKQAQGSPYSITNPLTIAVLARP